MLLTDNGWHAQASVEQLDNFHISNTCIGLSMSVGNTLEFMLSAKRDARAAKRFFRKAMNAAHNQKPRVINVDKNAVITPQQMNSKPTKLLRKLLSSEESSTSTTLWNFLHRAIKRLVNPGMGFGSFNTARAFLERI